MHVLWETAWGSHIQARRSRGFRHGIRGGPGGACHGWWRQVRIQLSALRRSAAQDLFSLDSLGQPAHRPAVFACGLWDMCMAHIDRGPVETERWQGIFSGRSKLYRTRGLEFLGAHSRVVSATPVLAVCVLADVYSSAYRDSCRSSAWNAIEGARSGAAAKLGRVCDAVEDPAQAFHKLVVGLPCFWAFRRCMAWRGTV